MREPVLNLRRRDFVRAGAGVMAGIGLPLGVANAAPRDPWAEAEAIIARCRRPIAFRQQDFLITAYGAQPCEVGQVDGLVEYRKEGKVNAPKEGSPDAYGAIKAAINA